MLKEVSLGVLIAEEEEKYADNSIGVSKV